MYVKKNCLLCMQLVWLKMCSIFGFIGVFSSNCKHTDKEDVYEFKRSNVLCVFILTKIIILWIVSFIDIKYFYHTKDFTTLSILKIITETLLIMNTTHFQIYYIYTTNDRIIEYRGLIEILKNCRFFGLNEILTVKYIIKYRKMSIIILTTLVCIMIFYTLFVLVHLKYDLFLYLKTLVQIYSAAVDFLHVTYMITMFSFYRKLLKKCYIKMKVCLQKRNQHIYQFQNCSKELKLLNRYYLAIHSNWKAMRKCVETYVPFWFLYTVSMIILNIYIAMKVLIHNFIKFDISYNILQMRILAFCFIVTMALTACEKIKEPVSFSFITN